MRKTWLPLMTAAAVLLSSPLLAGDDDKHKDKEKQSCSYEVEDCVQAMKEKFSQRGWVGINMETDEEAGGVWGAEWMVEHRWDAIKADYVLTEDSDTLAAARLQETVKAAVRSTGGNLTSTQSSRRRSAWYLGIY